MNALWRWKWGLADTAKEAIRGLLPADLRPHKVLAGPLRGSRIYTSWHDYPGAILGTTERSLLYWFQANVRPGETWLDIGAHYGYTSIALCKLAGRQGRVFAFEPVPSTAAALERTRQLNSFEHLTIVPLALGNGLKSMSFPCTRGMADSTLRCRESLQNISIVSLDDYWQELARGSSTIHGVKIDVQGMESQVLQGMRKLLAAWTPKLVIEFHTGVNREAILTELATLGYSATATPIDESRACRYQISDDQSYFFTAKLHKCESSSIRLTSRLS